MQVKNGRRRAAAAVMATLGVIAVPVAAGAASQTSVTGIPGQASCAARMYGVDAQQRIVSYDYQSDNGKGVLYTGTVADGTLGFAPRAMVAKGSAGAGSPDALGTSGKDFYANAADGSLYVIGVNDDGTMTKKKVNSTWGGIRAMAAVPTQSGGSRAYVYALTDAGGFNRYSTPKTPTNMIGPTVIASSGWKGVKTLSFYRITTLPDGQAADVLLATLTTGQLVEYTIPVKTPTKWTRKDVRTSSWQNITSLTVGVCSTQPGKPTGSVWIGTVSTGDAYLYLDKNSDSPASADITGYGKFASGWTKNTYGGSIFY